MNSSVFFLIGVESTELTERERALFAKFPPGGVILFARNMADPDQLHSLVAEIRERAPGVLLFVDQEGGPVDRFRAIAGSSVSAARAARIGASRAAGEIAGALCSLFGIDVDLAPVVDRAVPAAGGVVLTERVVAENPDDVAKAGRQFLDGLALYGVAGCLKHFPGLGRGAVDSHVLLPVIDDDPRQLELDLLPFRKLRDAPAVMVSHAAFGRGALPSSLSRAVAHDLLREEAGFPGAAISDDLEMGALSAFGSLADRSAAALAAGCDLLCIGKQNEALPDAVEAVERMVPARRTLEALERLDRFRGDLARIRAATLREPARLAEIISANGDLKQKGERG